MSSKHERRRRERPRVIEGSSVSQGEPERKEPGVSLEFFGYFHHPLNLQAIPRIERALEAHVTSGNGGHILYLERPDATERQRAIEKGQIVQRGSVQEAYLLICMAGQLKRVPTNDELRARRQQIDNSELPDILNNGLLHYSWVEGYFLAGAIDRVRKRHSLGIDLEVHSETVARKSNELSQEISDFYNRVDWTNDNFGASLEAIKSATALDVQRAELREAEFIGSVAKRAGDFRKTGGSIFMLFGSMHAPMVDDIATKTAAAGINATTKIEQAGNANIVSILDVVRSKGIPLDEVVARTFLGMMMFERMEELFQRGSGNYKDFANNFESLDSAVQDVANNLSLDDIRSLHSTKASPLKVFFDHPAARVVLPYLR